MDGYIRLVEPSCNGTPRESDPRAAAEAQGALERMVESAPDRAAARARSGAYVATPATGRSRVSGANLEWLSLEEATPTSVLLKVRVKVRFVLSVVAMTWLTLPQKGLLGRNLITLFQCVNTFAKIFCRVIRHTVGLRDDASPTGTMALCSRVR